MKRQKSILIVDDDNDLAEQMIEMLDPIYEEVLYSSSAIKAQEHVKKRTFSLIISDISMPEMLGHEFVAFLRSVGRIEPVIFVTGNTNRKVLFDAIRLGVADVIEKPFIPSTLLESVERTLEIDKRRTELYRNVFENQVSENSHDRQKRMIGLLQVAQTKKNRKTG